MVTNQNRLSPYLGFLLYFHESQSYTHKIHIKFYHVSNIAFERYFSYFMLEHE